MASCRQVFKVRWIFGLMAFWGLFFNYATKVILSAAMEAMVLPEGLNYTETEELEPSSNDSSTSIFEIFIDQPDQLYSWSFETQNSLKEAFFYGYIMTGIIGGRLAERISVKHTVGTTVLLSSLLSLLLPFTPPFGTRLVFGVRFLQGLVNGMIDPGLNTIFSRYIPADERSTWASIVYSGSALGTMIMLIVTGKLSEYQSLGGWRLSFYSLGLLGLIWYILWQICVAESPQDHWFISKEELQEITQGTQINKSKKPDPIPWKAIATSVPFMAIAVSSFVYNWAYLTMLTQLPKYFHRVLGFDVAQSDVISSLPYIAQSVLSYVAGVILDWLRRRGDYSVTCLRKTFNTIGFIGPAICLVLNCFSGHNKYMALSLMTLNLGLCGFAISGFKIANVDMSPTFAGTLLGIANTVGNIPGILAPMLVSGLVSADHTVQDWNRVFLVSAGFFVLGTLVFILFGSADLQTWDPTYRSDKDINGIGTINHVITLNELGDNSNQFKTDTNHSLGKSNQPNQPNESIVMVNSGENENETHESRIGNDISIHDEDE